MIYRRALAYYLPFWRSTVLAALLTLAAIYVNLKKPLPFAQVIGVVLPAAANGQAEVPAAILDLRSSQIPEGGASIPLSQALLILCAMLVGLHLIAGAVNLWATMIFIRVGLQALLRLRTELYAYLHSLPLKFHDQRRSADSSFRVAYDSQAIQAFYSQATFIYFSSVTIIATFGAMWRLDRVLTILALLVLPFMLAVTYIYAKRIRRQSTAIAERESAVLTQAQEGLSSVKMVQAFGREDHEVEQFRTSANQSLEANIEQTGTSMRSSLIVSTLIALSTALTYYVGAKHVLAGTLTLTQLIYVSSLLLMLYGPLEGLIHVAWALEGAAASAQRCFEVLDKQDDVPDLPHATALPNARGEIVFQNVAFGYTPQRPIFSGVNLRIEPGQTVAFVGATGAGKSTLLSLVPRFYDPSAGCVLLDGHDVRSVTKKSLRNQVSIVLQDTLLFSTTVRENIAYGRPDATEEEIVHAARQAQAHEFITAMPDGYRSQVGERGGHLSVGQRQRIGIARAFLKNAPILLLDEPTSALDPTTESAIMKTIEELMRGRTTLIITHRIATVHGIEKIVVLGSGGVVEEGQGPELVDRGGVYAGLYRSANLGI